MAPQTGTTPVDGLLNFADDAWPLPSKDDAVQQVRPEALAILSEIPSAARPSSGQPTCARRRRAATSGSRGCGLAFVVGDLSGTSSRAFGSGAR
jgi:hypothetical protein